MFIYLAVLLAPLSVGLMLRPSPRQAYPGLWIFFAVVLLFCGLRYEVGPDWQGYLGLYDLAVLETYGEALSRTEPTFYLLAKLSEDLGTGFAGVVFSCSLIFLVGCFRYARSTPNPWLAVAAVMPYLIFIISTSGLRQACAIGVSLALLANWRQSSTTRKLLLIALASSFHNTAGILFLFMVYGMKSPWYVRLLLTLFVAAVVGYAMTLSESIDRYTSVYVEQNLVSEGAFFHVLLIAFPASLYLMFRKKLAQAGLADTNVFLASILTLVLMLFLPLSSTGIDRLTLYFSFVQMWTYPALLSARVIDRAMVKIGIAIIVLSTFFTYFMFGAHVSAYVPYKSILLL